MALSVEAGRVPSWVGSDTTSVEAFRAETAEAADADAALMRWAAADVATDDRPTSCEAPDRRANMIDMCM